MTVTLCHTEGERSYTAVCSRHGTLGPPTRNIYALARSARDHLWYVHYTPAALTAGRVYRCAVPARDRTVTVPNSR